MSHLKVAVIGGGHLGRIHARLLASRSDVELIGVVDPIAASRDEVAALANTEAHANVSTLIGRMDAAVVATPTQSHHDVAVDLLRRGVHVLVEKPIAATLEQADAMIEMARRAQVVLAVGHVERFNPVVAYAGAHTGPRFLEAVRSGPYTFRSTDVGVVHDLMIHDIDLTLSMIGAPIRKVDAVGAAVLGGHEDVASARIEFACGCVAALSASRVSFEATRSMRIFSRSGFVGLDFAGRTATVVRIGEAARSGELVDPALTSERKRQLTERFFTDVLPTERYTAAEANPLADEQTDFLESIRQRRQPRVCGRQGRAALALCEQVVRALGESPLSGVPFSTNDAWAPTIAPTLAPGHPWLPLEVPQTRREAG